MADLGEIADYIARDSPHYASTFIIEIRRAARSLRRFAFRSRAVPEVGRDDVRELLISNYRLIFQVTSDQVKILAVIHGARDLSERSE